jgi:hypothetical protein
MIPPPVISENLVLPEDDDLITFNPNATALDSGVLPSEMPSFSDIMIPGERLKETATNVRELLDRRRSKGGLVGTKDVETVTDKDSLKDNQKHKDMPQEMQATVDRIMEEVDEEMTAVRGTKGTEKERGDIWQSKHSGDRGRDGLAEGRTDSNNTSERTDKLKTDSDDPKS